MNWIICLGNPFVESDSLGPRVFAELSARELPPGVEIIDGGLAGLNLLCFLDGCQRVVLADAIIGAETPAIMEASAGAEFPSVPAFGHSSGAGYLLRARFALGGPDIPQIFVIGAESGQPQVVREVAGLCLQVALHGRGAEAMA